MLYATHLDIDLGAIRHNLRGIRTRVGDRQVLAAVKANAYGHGAVPIARLMQSERFADWLGVATVPEALELRSAGITLPILKFSPTFPEELSAALAGQVSLTVVDVATVAQAAAAAAATGTPASVQLAVDTGMRRIGCPPEQAIQLARMIDDQPGLRLEGVFTHMPVSDTADGAEYSRAELNAFRRTVADIQADRGGRGLAPVPLVHAASSGGVLQHDLSGLTMVRPGLMIYGLYPDPSTPRTVDLRPALAMHSRVSFIKRIAAGDTVSYGRTWTAPVDTWIATVPVGYADGFSRLNSNRGRMLINGHSYPVVGRVCMDQTMLDLGPEDPGVAVGDVVTVIGTDGDQTIDMDEIAATMGTISYEVSCLIPARVTRHYHDDQGE
jgi:alanine racemase